MPPSGVNEMTYYPETRYVVCTANPDLKPLAVYEVERGVFSTPADAIALMRELSAMGEPCQCYKRRWIEASTDFVWMNRA